jgi:hypothetical protein
VKDDKHTRRFAPVRLYRGVLRLYPAEFRDDYGAEMTHVFREEYGKIRTHGSTSAIGFRMRMLYREKIC